MVVLKYTSIARMDYLIRFIFIIFIVSCITGFESNGTSTTESNNSSVIDERVNETNDDILLEKNNSSSKTNLSLSVELNSTNEIEKISVKLSEKHTPCTCSLKEEFWTENDQFQCPCLDAGTKFNVSCKSLSSEIVSSVGMIKCEVIYIGNLLYSTFPFTCDCVVNTSRQSKTLLRSRFAKISRQRLKKIECDCVDTESDAQVCNCSAQSPPEWCNCTEPCVCHERQIYPNVVLRYNCTCNAMDVNNTTIIIDPPVNNDNCEVYEYGDGNVTVWVKCNFDESTTISPTSTMPSVDVFMNCHCDVIQLEGGKSIILHNCRCNPNQTAQDEVLNLELEKSNCHCTELKLKGGITVKYNCVCQSDRCRCEEARGILVCVNCEFNSTSLTKMSTYDYYQPKCGCEEVELFNGQVLVQVNCSCSPRTKVLHVRHSRQTIHSNDYSPCRCRKNGEIPSWVKRETAVPALHLVCSCNVTEENPESNTMDSIKTDTSSSTSQKPSSTLDTPPSSTLDTPPSSTLDNPPTSTFILSTDPPLQDIPKEEFWIRTVLRNSSSLNFTQVASGLALAYIEAFHLYYKQHLGLPFRAKRQVTNNVTVQLIRVNTYPDEDNPKNSSRTEFVYAVRYDGDLVKPAVAVQDAKLLLHDNRIEKILRHPVTLVAEEYIKPTNQPMTSDSSTPIVIVGIVVPLLLLLLATIGFCFWKKTRKSKNLSTEIANRQQMFQEMMVRNPLHQKSKMEDPLLTNPPPAPQLPIPRSRVRSNDKNFRNNEFSRESFSRKRSRRKRRKNGRPLPLDIHRQTEGSPIKHGVFDHVPDSPIIGQTSTPKIQPRTLLFPVTLENPIARSSGLSSDVATISGSMEPFPAYHWDKRHRQSKSKLDEVDAMLESRANRVCSSERLIEDIREELQKFHRSISDA